ncbi:hypothetical protein TNCV_1195051 [Trichonephila clavipes]|nr:hypothetical protein TNCV_1195051 [Trichonephila clavipes]
MPIQFRKRNPRTNIRNTIFITTPQIRTPNQFRKRSPRTNIRNTIFITTPQIIGINIIIIPQELKMKCLHRGQTNQSFQFQQHPIYHNPKQQHRFSTTRGGTKTPKEKGDAEFLISVSTAGGEGENSKRNNQQTEFQSTSSVPPLSRIACGLGLPTKRDADEKTLPRSFRNEWTATSVRWVVFLTL